MLSMKNKNLPKLCDDKICTGCLACVNACNNGALTCSTDDEGFYRPRLNTDECVMCGLCESSCPIITPVVRQEKDNLKVYAAWHIDDNVRAKSTSGGVFTALASVILNRGGMVYGAAYTSDLHIEHIGVEDEVGLEKLRLSKYAQSCTDDIFVQVRQRLVEGRMVMFVGTPCQVAGLKNYLHKDYDNLLLVDFICHGVASMDFLHVYIHWLEEKYGKVNNFNFRDKRKGWYDSLRVIEIDDKKEQIIRGGDDNYWVAYNNKNNSLQESCYNCPFQNFPRCSDITIADFWRIGHHIPFGHIDEIEKGVSLIAVNDVKAMTFVDEASTNLYMEERTLQEVIEGNKAAVESSARPVSRDTIYKDIRSMNYEDFYKKYMSTTWKQDAVKIFREYLPFSMIKYIRMRKQK